MAFFCCINGHYLGGKEKACACGGRIETGRKVSLFLPESLHEAIAADARTLDESISAQIVRLILRARDRKRPRAKGAKV
jgi:hypothetical protein